VGAFKNITALLFLLFLIIGLAVFNYSAGLIMAAAAGAAPFLLLRVKLERERSRASFEAEQLVVSILNKYRISRFNIEEALEAVIADVADLPLTRKMLFHLLIKMRTTKNKEEIHDATRIFAYNIGTNWAKMLANNIFQAEAKGINVILPLEDILSQLREARVLAEERKRSNLESVILVKLFCPGVYLVFSYFAIEKFNLGLAGFLYLLIHRNPPGKTLVACAANPLDGVQLLDLQQ
jgi:predicted hydrocarbon binding protein